MTRRTLRDPENHPCSFLIINIRATRESSTFYASSPGSRTSKPMETIVENRFYISIVVSKYCSGDKSQGILFRSCNFKFPFLHIVLRCYDSYLFKFVIDNVTQKSFPETLFLIVILLHLIY